jgi:hypothetical protein
MLSETVDERGEKVVGVPSLSPDFLIETYLDHQVSPDRSRIVPRRDRRGMTLTSNYQPCS